MTDEKILTTVELKDQQDTLLRVNNEEQFKNEQIIKQQGIEEQKLEDLRNEAIRLDTENQDRINRNQITLINGINAKRDLNQVITKRDQALADEASAIKNNSELVVENSILEKEIKEKRENFEKESAEKEAELNQKLLPLQERNKDLVDKNTDLITLNKTEKTINDNLIQKNNKLTKENETKEARQIELDNNLTTVTEALEKIKTFIEDLKKVKEKADQEAIDATAKAVTAKTLQAEEEKKAQELIDDRLGFAQDKDQFKQYIDQLKFWLNKAGIEIPDDLINKYKL